MVNGEIKRLPRDEYDRLSDRVNWSSLKLMERSPAHYRHGLFERQEDTDAMVLGRVTHIAAFEPERFGSDVAIWEGRRAGKEWEAFVKANREREIIKDEPAREALAMGAAARASAGGLVSKGRAELSMLWTWENGLTARGRIDFLSEEHGIVDLKTCRDASPDGFGRAAASMRYHVQAAYYVDGYERIAGRRVPYTIVAVESSAPHVVAVYQLTEEQLLLGRQIYEALLDRLLECRETSSWPGYPTQQLHLPAYAIPSSDDDLAGLGLSF